MDLTQYRALSFDVYGTLIDWEAGIASVLSDWAATQGLDLSDDELLVTYAANEAAAARDQPGALYPRLLAEAFQRTAVDLKRETSDTWARRLGDSVPDWPAFSDSAQALATLAQHYRLIIVSNVHRDGFAGSNLRLAGEFAAVITAEDVGAYKPADPHFEMLESRLQSMEIEHSQVLHVAQSLFHDHVPAKRRGLDSVWINRRHDRPGWGATPEPAGEWAYLAEYPSMAAFTEAVREAFGD